MGFSTYSNHLSFSVRIHPTMKELKQKREKIDRTHIRRRPNLLDPRSLPTFGSQRQISTNQTQESNRNILLIRKL